MTTQSTFTMTDLVLRLAGGQRDGELIPVTTTKCFLGMDQNDDGTAQNPQCAIFRGPNGAAVKSFGDDVMVNGAVATVHWLQEGDRIEFPNSMALEIAQLGWVETASGEYASVENEYRKLAGLPMDEESNACRSEVESCCTADGTDTELCQSIGCQGPFYLDATGEDDETNQEETTIAGPVTTPSDERLELMESQIQDIQKQNSQTQERFDKLDGQLGNLGEQLSQLVSMVGSNNTPQLGSVQPQVDAVEVEEAKPAELELSEIASPDSGSTDSAELESEYYSYRDDDDEKIMTFDSSEVDSRLSEMERVFGGQLAELDDESVSTDSETVQSVNGQLSDTFESMPHSQDEEVAPFADNSLLSATDEPTVSAETDSLSEPPQDEVSLAKQLIMEVDQLEPAPVDEPAVENAVEEPTVEETTNQSTGNESVSELLERMKSEGQWDGIPDEGDDVSPVEPVEPIAAVAEIADVSTGDASGDDVEDYMSQLLSRMRGDNPATPQKAKPVANHRPTPKKQEVEKEEETFVPPENPLKPGEFKPLRKAQKIGSLSAMRELANSSARTAVRKSEHTRRKTLGFMQIGTSFASFLIACYFLLVDSTQLFDTGFIIGLTCIIVCGFLCYRFYKTMQHNELVSASPVKTEKKAEEAQQDEAEVASTETEA